MPTTINVNRQIETIRIEENGNTLYSWEVATDDESVIAMLAEITGALDRAQALVHMAGGADEAEAQAAKKSLVLLQKRAISAVIGEQGYHDVLCHIGNGTPCDPAENIRNIGDVFAELCMWVYERCTPRILGEASAIASSNLKKKPKKRPKKKGKRK